MDIQEMKKDIIDYDLYWVVDSVEYDDYYLTIINESDSIIIHITDDEGSATGLISKDEFLNISTNEELERHINSIIYYNYVEGE